MRARVANLSESCTGITVNGLINAFSQTLGTKPLPLEPSPWATAKAQCLAGDAWLFRQMPAFDVSHDLSRPDGVYQIDLQIENGVEADTAVSTDSLDPRASDSLRSDLLDKRYETLLANWQASKSHEKALAPNLKITDN